MLILIFKKGRDVQRKDIDFIVFAQITINHFTQYASKKKALVDKVLNNSRRIMFELYIVQFHRLLLG